MLAHLRYCLYVAICAGILFTDGAAIALPLQASTVVVVPPDAGDRQLMEAFSRLCGELHMYGLRIAVADPQKDPLSPDDVLATAQAARAVAVVLLARSAGWVGAEMWVVEETRAKGSVRITVTSDDEDAPSLLAIRAVDLLRGSLGESLRQEISTKAEESAAVASPVSTASSPAEFKRWNAGVAATLLVEGRQLGSGVGPRLDLERMFSPRVALAVSVAAPLLGQSFGGDGAKASVREEMATVALFYRVMLGDRVMLDMFEGLGGLHMTVRGEVSSPWIANSSAAWFVTSTTGGRAVVQLSRTFSLRVAAAALFLWPSPVVDVAASSYRLGQPLLLATAGLHTSF